MSFCVESKKNFKAAVKERNLTKICEIFTDAFQQPICTYYARTCRVTEELVEESINSFLHNVIENNTHPIFSSQSPFNYMMVSIKNSLIDELKMISSSDDFSSLDTLIDYGITDTEELNMDILDETRLYVQEAIERLPPKQKRVIKYLLTEVEFDFIKGDFQSNSTKMADYFNDTSASTVRANKKKAYENFKKIYIDISGGGI